MQVNHCCVWGLMGPPRTPELLQAPGPQQHDPDAGSGCSPPESSECTETNECKQIRVAALDAQSAGCSRTARVVLLVNGSGGQQPSRS